MDVLSIIFLSLAILFFFGLVFLFIRSRKLETGIRESKNQNQIFGKEIDKLKVLNQSLLAEREAFTARYKSVIDAEAERQKILGDLELNKTKLLNDIQQIELNHQQSLQSLNVQIDQSNQEFSKLQENIETIRQEIALLDETASMQSFGFYNPRFSFESSSRYQLELERIRSLQKAMISSKSAAFCTAEWSVNGSRAEGRKQTNQSIKLILRALNGECDAAIAKVKYNNVKVMEARILKTFEALNKLVSVQSIYLSSDFLNSKLEELYLVHEYQEKVQEEKEEQRRIKEEMREEDLARREIEKALADAEREESRYADALRKAREEVETSAGQKQAKLLAQIQLLQERLIEAQSNRERAISRAQMTRSGHVYVISNIGSFGENIYKIGMTRRLDPLDRVRELGDASVPFRFDVHAIIYSEDAPTLEHKLHQKFHNRRVNQVNHRREFFQVTLDEISEAVHEFHGQIEFTLLAEAEEYRKTLAVLSEIQQIRA
jgi:hypothetical protein